jgi:hypothetical protein
MTKVLGNVLWVSASISVAKYTVLITWLHILPIILIL